jgi:hypothetical protein
VEETMFLRTLISAFPLAPGCHAASLPIMLPPIILLWVALSLWPGSLDMHVILVCRGVAKQP